MTVGWGDVLIRSLLDWAFLSPSTYEDSLFCNTERMLGHCDGDEDEN